MSLLRPLVVVAALHAVLLVAIVGYELFVITSSSLKYAVARPDITKTMRAAQFTEFGNASVVKLESIAQPACCLPGQVLVRVHAGALNPVDFKQRRSPAPSLLRPLPSVSGFDFSGVVEEVGRAVVGLPVGSAVFGMLPLLGHRWGAFQEFVVVDESIVALAPKSVPLREAASLPLVGLTVVHALDPVIRAWAEQGETPAGKRILIHAGAGGVGSFAIQYCKNVLGMRVATTAGAASADLVRKLGAEQVVDYRAKRFEDVVHGQDIVLDTVTQEYEKRTLSSPMVLKQGGQGHYCHIISTDWQPSARELNPIFVAMPLVKKWTYSALARWAGKGVHYHCNPVSPDGKGLASIADWVDKGLVKPVIDRSFPLEETAKAHAYLEEGHARGKVLIEVASITE